ncbi:hypothetical protein SAMD00019534_062200 [Acytostelium subglobosum LB1]|uniref:hypothetical protein n=1 Tax=Acytostelium subglobosum LB1 TaxID=1410327 RepID=UPI000644C9AD|nr:hypothetical protein SAMD00019534_062200 [Acytostelium subglobosum LB1]GAM23045.1 hypothetical protein SAMD00019534_062200 [Acytostelium subglobosum LB1]|eukprot:XP_012754272.1 hypothetical protein SAMD00019534_062200 [Acytostelium subglobosum LB1]
MSTTQQQSHQQQHQPQQTEQMSERDHVMTDDVFSMTEEKKHKYNPLLKDIMTKDIIGCKPTDSLEHVLEIMVNNGLKRLPVVNEQYKLMGIITDRDIRVYAKSPLETKSMAEWFDFLRGKKVDEVLPPENFLHSLNEKDTTLTACKTMVNYGITGIPVVNDEGKLTGIVSRSDLLDQFIRIAEPLNVGGAPKK